MGGWIPGGMCKIYLSTCSFAFLGHTHTKLTLIDMDVVSLHVT